MTASGWWRPRRPWVNEPSLLRSSQRSWRGTSGNAKILNQRLTFVHDPYDLPVIEVAEGIWRIELPTPWPVGPVHAYLIDDEPLTLFDSGPLYDPAFAALDAGLAARGHRVEDLERIV